ncbi:MAG: HAD hydrolase family protein [Candidatus Omnitrophica bacterium]|nr:HAD hydrolase family protein [Candidatus Omnitrophota bacterium]
MAFEYSPELIEKAGKIRLLVLDVDGVMTDGRIIFGSFGVELKNFDVNDGLGIFLVKKAGIKCVLLTAKGSPAVMARAKQLKVDKVYKDIHYKINALGPIRDDLGVSDEEICFMGDDLIDIPVLRRIGLSVCPDNAMDDVKKYCDIVTTKKGGHGAVRELCEFLLKAQGKWREVTSRYFE